MQSCRLLPSAEWTYLAWQANSLVCVGVQKKTLEFSPPISTAFVQVAADAIGDATLDLFILRLHTLQLLQRHQSIEYDWWWSCLQAAFAMNLKLDMWPSKFPSNIWPIKSVQVWYVLAIRSRWSRKIFGMCVGKMRPWQSVKDSKRYLKRRGSEARSSRWVGCHVKCIISIVRDSSTCRSMLR